MSARQLTDDSAGTHSFGVYTYSYSYTSSY